MLDNCAPNSRKEGDSALIINFDHCQTKNPQINSTQKPSLRFCYLDLIGNGKDLYNITHHGAS
jgi:hypothetical protein